MTSPSSHFSDAFDAIDVDVNTSPTRAAIEHALSMCAPTDEPGFYLLDDAGGRFIVDREFGVVSLKDESLLERERGQVHVARLNVIEPSGASYEIELRLRLTGPIPQVAGYEGESLEGQPEEEAPVRLVEWVVFAAAACAPARAPLPTGETAPYGAMLTSRAPAFTAARLAPASPGAALAPAAARAAWMI